MIRKAAACQKTARKASLSRGFLWEGSGDGFVTLGNGDAQGACQIGIVLLGELRCILDGHLGDVRLTGEEGICKGCGVATLSISYYDLGVTTGKMAVKILTGEADISEMPIEYYQNPVKKYMASRCEALGIEIPEGYEAIAE